MATLADEIKKRRPFESVQQEAFLNTLRTAARLAADFERLFRTHDLCSAHYNVLRILAGEKSGGIDGLPVLEVRERLITPVPDITRLVDKLVAKGLVQREKAKDDGRVVLLKLTDRGAKLVAKLAEPVRTLHESQLAHMSRTELATLSRLLEKARSGES